MKLRGGRQSKRLKKASSPRRISAADQPENRAKTTNYYRPRRQVQVSAREDTKESDRKKSVSGGRWSLAKLANGLIILAFVVLVLFGSTYSSTPTVRLSEEAARYQPISAYQDAARELLQSSILNRSKLFFRSQSLEQDMLDRFPELSDVSVVSSLTGRNLVVSMATTPPLVKLQNGSRTGVVTEDGVYIDREQASEVNMDILVTLRLASPQAGLENGTPVLTSQEVSLLELLFFELSSQSFGGDFALKPSEILFNVADGQLEVRFEGQSFFVKLSSYGDAREQVGAMIATLRQLDRDGGLPSQYLDVRVPGRVFVL